jgi:hypothetical protein
MEVTLRESSSLSLATAMGYSERLSRGIHPWVIAAEDWDVEEWRRNLVGAPSFLAEAAREIINKGDIERELLLERAVSLPADSVEDYVRYEIIADICVLTDEALINMTAAVEMNDSHGQPRLAGGINWRAYYYA